MLQEVFEKLQALQDVLEQIYKIERELEEIPKAILTEKELLTRLKKQFVEKSGNLEKRQLKVKELKSQLHDAEDKRSSYEKQMDVIKTQKENFQSKTSLIKNNDEYRAALLQIEQCDKAISVIGVDATDAAIEAIKAGKMTATVKQDGDAMGEANIRIMMNYLLNGKWYEGLEEKYKLNDDGVSVYIPYAKITAESMK